MCKMDGHHLFFDLMITFLSRVALRLCGSPFVIAGSWYPCNG
jgi:hypothetical protein